MSILDKAKSLVQGARGKAYGHPREDFRCQAQMFNAYLQKKGILDIESHDGLQPEDVAMLMVLVKVARMAENYSEDSLVDIAGYAAACEMSQEERDYQYYECKCISKDALAKSHEAWCPAHGKQ